LPDPAARFEYGLEMLLGGLEAELDRIGRRAGGEPQVR
jgi:hypothetical protein